MNNLSAVQNQQRNRELAENVYRSAKIKYTEGIGSNLELSDAEINLEVAETNYINSLLNVLVSKVDLDAALGNFKP
jgi:outer membrane protein TolC